MIDEETYQFNDDSAPTEEIVETSENVVKISSNSATISADDSAAILGAVEEIQSSQIIPPVVKIENVVSKAKLTNYRGKPPPITFRRPIRRPKRDENAKKRKPVLIKCTHDGPHFEKSFVDESLTMNQISIVMNPPCNSVIWSFCGFPEIDGQICTNWILCTICRSIFLYCNSATSGPKRHIETKHKQILNAVRDMAGVEPGQILVADYGDNSVPVRLVSEDDINDVSLKKRLQHEFVGGVADPAAADSAIEFEDAEKPLHESRVGSSSPLKRFVQKIKSEKSSTTPKVAGNNIVAMSSPSGNTKCAACEVDFKNVALAMMHQSCHGNDEKFSCAQCDGAFENVFDFWGHIYGRNCPQS